MTEENGDQKILHQRSGTIPALADEELMGDDDEYDDLYSDVNVGESFFQAHNQPQPPAQVGGTGSNASLQGQNSNVAAEPRMGTVSGGNIEGKYRNDGGHNGINGPDTRSDVYPQGSKGLSIDIQNKTVQQGQGSMSVQLNSHGFSGNAVNVPEVPMHNSFSAAPQQIPVSQMNVNPNAMVNKSPAQPFVVDNGNTMLFVGELHWWTTDAEIESVLSQYGRVKEIKFFDERVSGKSKGYCQVEFYESAAAAACKEGMNGYVFNGKACVVAFASPETLKQMGANFTGRNQGQNQIQNRRPMNDGMGRGHNNYNNNNMNMQNGDAGRNYGRGGFARGNQGMGNRGGPWNGGMRGRGVNNGAGPYGPGLAGPGPGFGGMMHPQGMMGAAGGFDPTFMGRGGGYGGGYPGLAYPGMPHSYPGVNPMGMERGENIPPEDSFDVARKVKEMYCYTCSDIVKEFNKHDKEPAKYIKQWKGVKPKTGAPYTCDVGYERFLGPEVFFNPEIYSNDFTTALPAVIDKCIQSAPIDTRRALYKNIVLSGGSTMFKDFGRRLQRDLKKIVDARVVANNARTGGEITSQPVEVNVVSHPVQRFAVWFGGSVLSSTPEFFASCRTKEEYEEYGASICRTNPVFKGMF